MEAVSLRVLPSSRRKPPIRWTLTNPPDALPTGIRTGLLPRVIYFPEGWLTRIESNGPGALTEVLTLALAEFAAKGGV